MSPDPLRAGGVWGRDYTDSCLSLPSYEIISVSFSKPEDGNLHPMFSQPLSHLQLFPDLLAIAT